MNNALAELGVLLRNKHYQFTTVTPESHKRNLSKDSVASCPLRELFGWNRPVSKDSVPSEVYDLLRAGEALAEESNIVHSRVRYSTCGGSIFLHSGFPTDGKDAVFFGPDSYRFVRYVRQNIKPGNNVVDIGGGSGVGGISIADSRRNILITDINPKALEFTKVNARINGVAVQTLTSDVLKDVPPGYDTLIANPPFIVDSQRRSYRDGGDNFGTGLSVKIVKAALNYLPAGGQLLLYTATCFVDGHDVLLSQLRPLLDQNKVSYTYEEIDPDIFGEELCESAYGPVERLAAVGLNVRIK